MQDLSVQLQQVATATNYSVPLLSFASADTNASQTVLILPALGIGAKFYQPLAVELANAGMHAVIFEQRGHGHSSLRASRHVDYGFKHWLQDDIPAAVEWIHNNYSKEVVLLGHSLGGHLAACYAGMYPRQVKHLVLSACGSPWLEAFGRTQRLQLRILQGASVMMGLGLGYYNGRVFGFGGHEAKSLMQDWRQMVSSNSYRAIGMSQDLDQGVHQYQGRVLCVRYTDDVLAPEKSVRAVSEKFASADLRSELIGSEQLGCKADHVNWVRKPTTLTSLITQWLG